MENRNSNVRRTRERVQIGAHVTIYPRGTRGIWCADIQYVDANGQRKHTRKSLSTRVRRIAEQAARKLDNQYATGSAVVTNGTAKTQPIAISEAIDLFVESKRADGLARKTLYKYRSTPKLFATHLLEHHGIETLQKVAVSHIDTYRRDRIENARIDHYTVHNELTTLKCFLAWCWSRGLVETNPFATLRLKKPRRRRHPAATIDEVNAILNKAEGMVHAVIMTAAFTGLRIGEIAALRFNEVDLEHAVVHVRHRQDWKPKTVESERDIPIHPRLLAVLKTLRRSGDWFFTAPPSRRFPRGDHHLNPRDINEQFQALAKSCGFEVGRDQQALTFHSLRRFFKTFCMDSGVPKPLVDRWMGHTNMNDMDFFYYDTRKSTDWMQRVPFGDPNGAITTG